MNIFYNLIVLPIESILEFSFSFTLDKFKSFGVTGAIIAVSLVMNFLALPLYNVADALQEKERHISQSLAYRVSRIKKAFKGDEQFMMLSTYYRQKGYHPLYALRSALSILIEIPFFIAGYHFLSHCPALEGQSILFLKNLGAPDALIQIPFLSGISINLLPILMTVINTVSNAVYTKDIPLREKLQGYGLALIFLILLYNSPSGLVFYWILNNLFSLFKNIVKKTKNPLFVLYIIVALLLALVNITLFFFAVKSMTNTKFALVILDVIFILVPFANNLTKKNRCQKLTENKILFFTSAISLSILTGYLIPSTLISSSPEEFSFLKDASTPFAILSHSLFLGLGFFFLWPLAIYKMFGEKTKKIIPLALSVLLGIFLLDFFVFSKDYGLISTLLMFDDADNLIHSKQEAIMNIAIATALSIAIILLYIKNKHKLMNLAAFICLFALSISSLINTNTIKKGYDRAYYIRTKGGETGTSEINLNAQFSLSKTGQNVFCIMIDKAVSAYIDEMLEEDKNLQKQFDGFTLYPNTITFGPSTFLGSMPLFGGYEYTPAMVNLRNEESIAKKREEALSLLPILFAREGYRATMTDMPYAYLSDFFFMDKLPEKITSVKTFGKYSEQWKKQNGYLPKEEQLEICKKKIFLYSLLRCMPNSTRKSLYHYGNYFTTGNTLELDANSHIDNYSVLDFLPQLTDCNSEKPSFTYLVNEITHEPLVLQCPEYKPTVDITQTSPSATAQADVFYYCHMAAFKLLGKWFDYLKENEVYDNTRIIIVSDHGNDSQKYLSEYHKNLPVSRLSPILLVKDFNSHGSLKKDFTFMTNADVPAIATKDLLQNPSNPWTGRSLEFTLKDPAFIKSGSHKKDFTGNTYSGDEWITCMGDISNSESWESATSETVYPAVEKYIQDFDRSHGLF